LAKESGQRSYLYNVGEIKEHLMFSGEIDNRFFYFFMGNMCREILQIPKPQKTEGY